MRRATAHPGRAVDAAESSTDEPAESWSRTRPPLTRRRWFVHVSRLLFLGAALLLWHLLSGTVVPTLLISSPEDVGEQIVEWIEDGTYLQHTFATVWVAIVGFLIGALTGITVGYLLGMSHFLGQVFGPFITALYTIPRVALAPLFILWFGIDIEFKMSFTIVLVGFLVFYSTYFGVREVPRDLIDVVRLMGASRVKIARSVILPSALVWVAAGLKTSVPYALVGVVVAELLVSTEGLGYLVRFSSSRFDSAGTYAAIVALGLVGLALDTVVTMATKKPMEWKQHGAAGEPAGA